MRKGVVHEVLGDAAYQHESTAVISGSAAYTYGTIYDRVIRLADSMVRLGVGQGTVVGVMDVNSHRYFELKYALSLIGAVIHTINFRLSAEDVMFTLHHAHDDWVFLWDGFGDVAEQVSGAVPNHVWMTELSAHDGERDYETLIAEGRPNVPDVAARISPSDAYSIFYTTGTTGVPKGIRYTHQQMLMGALQIAHHLGLHDTGARLSAQDVMMPLIPFFHIHGWGVPFIAPYLGTALVLPERGGPAEQIGLIQRHQVTWSNMVPTQLFMLLEEAKRNHMDALNLKVLTGGSPLALGMARQADRMGMAFSLIYGGSDQLGSAISTAPGLTGEERLERLSSQMTPFPMTRIDVRDDTGDLVPDDGNSLGEVWIQSPWLPEGYLGNPDQSVNAFRDGWFRSGDLAVRYPDGSFYVMDRIKDAIKSGGEWIAGSLIESVISEVPGVKAVAVIAALDERWGKRPKAVVEAMFDVREDTVRAALNRAVAQGRLAKFWIPDTIDFIDVMPMTSAGKINKAVLRGDGRLGRDPGTSQCSIRLTPIG